MNEPSDIKNDKYILQSVSNTLDLLNIMAQHDKQTAQELSELSGFGKSSVFRMLATLEAKRFVRKSDDARYSLDMQLAHLGNMVLERIDVVKFGHSKIEELSDITGETVHLSVIVKELYVCFVDKVVGSATIHMDSRLGFERYAHLVSAGKAILAYQSPEKLERYMRSADFTKLTPNSIASPEELRAALEKARELGYTCDDEESEPSLVCFGAPIFDYRGQVAAAVSISGPAERMRRNKDENIRLVKETAKKISDAMRMG